MATDTMSKSFHQPGQDLHQACKLALLHSDPGLGLVDTVLEVMSVSMALKAPVVLYMPKLLDSAGDFLLFVCVDRSLPVILKVLYIMSTPPASNMEPANSLAVVIWACQQNTKVGQNTVVRSTSRRLCGFQKILRHTSSGVSSAAIWWSCGTPGVSNILALPGSKPGTLNIPAQDMVGAALRYHQVQSLSNQHAETKEHSH